MNSIKNDIKKVAIQFADDNGYNDENEKDRLVYNFTAGANYVLKKVFESYLCGDLDFVIEIS